MSKSLCRVLLAPLLPKACKSKVQPEGNPGVCSHPLPQHHVSPRSRERVLGTARRAASTSAVCSASHITRKTSALSRLSFRQAPLVRAWQGIRDVLAAGREMCTQQHPTATTLFPVQPSRAKWDGVGNEGKSH